MHKNRHKKFYIIIGSIILLFIFFIIYLIKVKNINQEILNIDVRKNLHYISDRCILEFGEKIYIGNTKNEIENGYFDICIELNEDKLRITINKIYKNNYTLIDEQYLNEIVYFICENLNNKIDKQKLLESIKNMYLNLRTNIERI